ncbi:MAG: aspartate aminotransferase family protein [Clostridia bacterium]|nr:aspartate aminotransferase family protein [Clostridia bacterium]
MRMEDIRELDRACFMNTFGERTPVAFDRGEGMYLYTTEDEKYLDMFAGIAVNSLGYNHGEFTKVIQEQAGKLLHTSSLYYIESQALLAKKLVDISCADRIYFANSGAEANEGAIKLAKIYFYKKGIEKYEVISLKSSFHGRTLATVAATGQEKYQKPYYPLIPGFKQVEINDIEALKAAVTDKTCAILLEPVQGESGVHPVDDAYIKEVRRICDEKEIILIFDEIQTGIGRCGKMFCYETMGVEPDIFTLAKALGNGIPIGAVCAKQFVADAFQPGDHGGTFGGNPLATRAGLCVLDIMEKENLPQNAEKMGGYIENEIMAKCTDKVKQIRRKGLMIGIEMYEPAADMRKKLFEKKILVGAVGNTLRVLPPLIIGKDEADEFIKAFCELAMSN